MLDIVKVSIRAEVLSVKTPSSRQQEGRAAGEETATTKKDNAKPCDLRTIPQEHHQVKPSVEKVIAPQEQEKK